MRLFPFLLLTATLALPAELPAASPEAPVTVSPGSPNALSRIRSLCPTFSWGGVAGAESYEIVVHRLVASVDGGGASSLQGLEPSPEPALSWVILGAARSFTPDLDGCLEAGEHYAWMLRAHGTEGVGPWSEPALLRVADDWPGSEDRRFDRADSEEAEIDGSADSTRDDDGRASASSERGAGKARRRSADRQKQVEMALAAIAQIGQEREPSSLGSEVRIGAGTNAPTLGAASFSASQQVHLGDKSAIFKDGSLFLWDEVRDYAGQQFGSLGLGRGALASNDSIIQGPFGKNNTALGFRTLTANTGGYDNTAVGAHVLEANVNSFSNTAVGARALEKSVSGSNNVAIGSGAMRLSVGGSSNVAIGTDSLLQNSEGRRNVALGSVSLSTNKTGENNIAIGYYAGLLTKGSNNIVIGAYGVPEESNVLRIGEKTGTGDRELDKVYVGGIRGRQITGPAQAVAVSEEGQLGAPGCGTYVPATSCPAGDNDGPRCDQVLPGSFCETDGECSLDGALNNCGNSEWYFRIK